MDNKCLDKFLKYFLVGAYTVIIVMLSWYAGSCAGSHMRKPVQYIQVNHRSVQKAMDVAGCSKQQKSVVDDYLKGE